MRGHWQLREVSICLAHEQPLIPLWTEHRPTDRYDIADRLRNIEKPILDRSLIGAYVAPTPYDRWLDQRLDAGEDETWLANVGLYPATTFCRLLGTELLRNGLRNSDISAHAAQAEGFSIASQGEAAIAGALRHLAMVARGANDEPNKAYGDLYSKLSRDYVKDPAFSVFRDLLRKEILDIWPFAAGEAILGEVQPGRRLHSVASAAQETGIDVAPST